MPQIVFIHGIDNKPEPDVLLDQWIRALAADGGTDYRDISQIVYWADVMYAEPLPHQMKAMAMAQDTQPSPEEEAEWLAFRESLPREWQAFAADWESQLAPPVAQGSAMVGKSFVPSWAARLAMRGVLRDVRKYLYNEESAPRGYAVRVRNEVRRRFLGTLSQLDDRDRPHIVVSHSMGTVIAYDCLKNVDGCPAIDGLITIGSPLGLDVVQQELERWTREDGFPSEKVCGRWVNVFDHFDIVAAFDGHLANDFQRKGLALVEDRHERNGGWWRHDIDEYLGHDGVRFALREMVGS